MTSNNQKCASNFSYVHTAGPSSLDLIFFPHLFDPDPIICGFKDYVHTANMAKMTSFRFLSGSDLLLTAAVHTFILKLDGPDVTVVCRRTS